jgi:hypothetical protein
LLSTGMMQDRGEGGGGGGSVSSELIVSTAEDQPEISTEQRMVVAQFPDNRNVVLLQFESSEQRDNEQQNEQKTQQNEELEMEVTASHQEGVSDEMATKSCYVAEELKDSVEDVKEEIVTAVQGEMVLTP